MTVISYVRRLACADDAQDLIEYALLVGLISLVSVVALTATGTSITGLFNAISSTLAKAT